MQARRAYEEIIDFIAAGSSSSEVAEYRPSEAAQDRFETLVSRGEQEALTEDEATELQTCLALEHIMRLAKVRARERLASFADPGRELPSTGVEE